MPGLPGLLPVAAALLLAAAVVLRPASVRADQAKLLTSHDGSFTSRALFPSSACIQSAKPRLPHSGIRTAHTTHIAAPALCGSAIGGT